LRKIYFFGSFVWAGTEKKRFLILNKGGKLGGEGGGQ